MSVQLTIVRYVVAVAAGIALAIFALCELGLAFPVAWWLYLLAVITFTLALIRRTPLRSQVPRLFKLGIIYAVTATLYCADWTSRKPFLRDLYSIRPGMTESEVRRIMANYTEGTGWPAIYGAPSNAPGILHNSGTGANFATGTSSAGQLTLNESLVFRHDTNGDFNSDWGIVTFKNGRVVCVSFSPD